MDKYTIIYDLSILPEGMYMDDLLRIKEEYGILFYDSTLNKNSSIFNVPKIVGNENDIDITVVDVSTEDGSIKYNELISKNDHQVSF